jgi:hypothetical protein
MRTSSTIFRSLNNKERNEYDSLLTIAKQQKGFKLRNNLKSLLKCTILILSKRSETRTGPGLIFKRSNITCTNETKSLLLDSLTRNLRRRLKHQRLVKKRSKKSFEILYRKRNKRRLQKRKMYNKKSSSLRTIKNELD